MYFKLQVIYKSYRQVTILSSFYSWKFSTSLDLLQTMVQETKETATFSSLLQCGRNGSFDGLEPLRVGATTLADLRVQAFSLGNAKLLRSIPIE
jgi:hypothetical protein